MLPHQPFSEAESRISSRRSSLRSHSGRRARSHCSAVCRPEASDAATAHAAQLLSPDEAGLFEQLQVLHDGGERHVEGLRQQRHGHGAVTQAFEHCTPSGVAKRLEDAVDIRLLSIHRPRLRRVFRHCGMLIRQVPVPVCPADPPIQSCAFQDHPHLRRKRPDESTEGLCRCRRVIVRWWLGILRTGCRP